MTHVTTLSDARRLLQTDVFSLVVLDPALPDGDARSAAAAAVGHAAARVFGQPARLARRHPGLPAQTMDVGASAVDRDCGHARHPERHQRGRLRMRKTLKSVLYVEDDIHVRTTAKLVLEVIGNIVVRDCGSGATTLLTARDFTPDLIVLDVMMPELDGVTTLEMLRRLPHLHDVPWPCS
ncbi:response regulator [Massilia sp. H-1]|nr:response regulator [Massilia sp. H-1]